jgi:hypothetical protein
MAIMSFIVGLVGRLLKNAVITHAAGALLAGGIAAGVAWIVIPTSEGPTPFTAVTRRDLTQAVRAAKRRVIATGYVLSDLDADLIKSQHDRLPDFEAIVVMVDPLGAGGPSRVMCQRQRDEEGDTTSYSNYSRVLNKLREFRSPAKTGKLLGNQLKVGVIDIYPTLGVILVDDDLYAYFYTYAGGGNSPVIRFENYVNTKDKRGEYFDDYLNKVTWYKSQVGVRKTKFLLTDKDWIPYETADNNQPCAAKQ